jgi:hypothetical protein
VPFGIELGPELLQAAATPKKVATVKTRVRVFTLASP